MIRGRALVAAVAAVAAAAVPSAAAAEAVGDQRVLLIQATWGPQPWAVADARRAAHEAEAFVARSSFGRLKLRVDVTPWLTAYATRPACPPPEHERIPPPLTEPPRTAAAAAGFPAEAYDRIVYAVAQTECPWRGVGVGREAMLNGEISPWILVHELGHTYGLAHARAAACVAASCRRDEYGDLFSPMGHGFVDFSAFEKLTLGWIDDVAHADRPGTYAVGRPDVAGASPYALVVPTAAGDYWLEQRLDVRPAGLAVRRLEPVEPEQDLARPTVLLEDPARAGRPTVPIGSTFRVAGAFSVAYTQTVPGRADLGFRWIDRTRPRVSSLRAPRRVRRNAPIPVSWRVRESGSGVRACTVALDRRIVATDTGDRRVVVSTPLGGTHAVRVACLDRAGNRSRPAARLVHVSRR